MKFAFPRVVWATMGCIGLGAAMPGHAADAVRHPASVKPGMAANVSAPWSNSDYARAKTLQPKAAYLVPSAYDYNAAAAVSRSSAVQGGGAASLGGRDATGLQEQRVYTAAELALQEVASDRGTTAVGTGGLHFTSSRTTPVKAASYEFPYRTIGKLYFIQNGLGYSCSASLIKPGIVVTAGHCVHDGSGSGAGWSSAFQFIPGYSLIGGVDTRPFGTWTNWVSATVSGAWYSGGGGVPNIRDYAVIVFGKNASGFRVGDYTGWMGYLYPSMIGKHMTVAGYPGNIDSGNILQRVDAQTTDGGTNNGLWGSNMRGGSSGGPVVLNFRNVLTAPNPPQDNLAARVTGVVSWGYIDTAVQVQGGSVFDANFDSIVIGYCSSYPDLC